MNITIFDKYTLFSCDIDTDTNFYNILGIKIKTRRKKISEKELLNLNYKYEVGKEFVPNVYSKDITLDFLIETNKSIARYGDGEFFLILGKSIPFQDYNSILSQKLREILVSQNNNILICIPDIFNKLSQYTKNETLSWRKFLTKYRESIYSILDFNKQYFDSLVSRPYINSSDKSTVEEYFKNFKKVWNNKKIVFVEGEFSRLGYGNDLFNNASSIKRIICPAKNAFEKYETILAECKKCSKENLFILALGPTATVLAHDLNILGYRALDLGHIDIEYEWFLKKANKKISIKNKYVNEAKKGNIIKTLNDNKYISEIIADCS